MRRILFALAAMFMLAVPRAAFSGVLTDEFYRQAGYSGEYEFWGGVAGGTNGTTLNDRMYTALGKWGFNSTSSLNDRLLAWSGKIARNPTLSAQDNLGRMSSLYKGLMFYKSFQDRGTTTLPEFSGGSVTATFTASRDSTHPATYFDANGVMQVTTTSNAIRQTYGYYDTTGWHAAPSMVLEGASTNLIVRTDGTASGSGLWTGWSITRTTANAPTTEQVSASPVGEAISGSYAQRVTYVSGADTNKGILLCSSRSAAGSVVQNSIVTVSCWAKTTGISGAGVQLHIYINNSSDGFVNEYDGSNVTLTSQWQRISYTATVTDATASKGSFRIGTYTGIDSADTWSIDVWGAQLEIAAYPSSFIPTTTAALTRNAEALSYASSGNFPAPSGGNCLSFDGQSASGDDYVSVANSATANQWYGCSAFSVEAWIFPRTKGEGSAGRIFDKRTAGNTGTSLLIDASDNFQINGDFSGGTNITSSLSIGGYNSWKHVVGVWTGSNMIGYVNGSAGSAAATSGTPLDDTALLAYIGNRSANDRTFDGFIQCVRIYRNKALSSGDVTALYNAGRGTAIASIPAVTGCTAEYLFNEGTGTTLTDSVAGNNGTISGATWSKDTHAGTILLKYRPVMLPNEQSSSYKALFYLRSTATSNSRRGMQYNTNASNNCLFGSWSNDNQLSVTSSALSTWTRYASQTLTGTYEPGSLKFYISAVSVGVPLTVSTMNESAWGTNQIQIQPYSGQAMLLEAIGIWNRALTAEEVAAVYADQSR